jgi:U3 small nucleolar RNA-associated protein 25
MFRSKYLRQSILLSRYETPEFRSLFNRSLYNVEGKIRVERTDFEGVLGGVRKGVKQVFTRLKGEDALEELEARFKFFTQTVSCLVQVNHPPDIDELFVVDAPCLNEVSCC